MTEPQSEAIVALIADDEDTNRLLLASAAQRAGFQVIEVADGNAALSAAMTNHFDIALLDVEMPGLNGFELCRALRAETHLQFKPIMMITGHDDAVSIEHAFEAGATDFMSKPLNWSLIPHRLRYMLRNARADERIRQMAYFDSLTGLPNLQRFTELGTDRISDLQQRPGTSSISILAVSTDGIARVNQSLGRAIADAAILTFSERLTSICEAFKTPNRFGQIGRVADGMFAILLCETGSTDSSRVLAQQLIAGLASPVHFGDNSLFLQPAIGIANFPDHGGTCDELLMNAEAAMQQARQSITSLAVAYSVEIGEKTRSRLRLDSDLRRAVRDQQLVLHFQPKVRIADNSFAGVEALLRWFHPELGSVSPTQFIPLAEESGLILELGDWIVHAAFRQLMHWRGAGLDTTIAVNFASQQFIHGNPARVIAAAAQATGSNPARMVVEITESTFIGDLATVQRGISDVRALGCRIAVDDFGTGYSSLAYLRNLPVDEIKVDRAFIERVDSDPIDAAIYSAVLDLARRLGLAVTAEGVETKTQLDWLHEHGCTEAQGFLIAEPMTGHEVIVRYGAALDVISKTA